MQRTVTLGQPLFPASLVGLLGPLLIIGCAAACGGNALRGVRAGTKARSGVPVIVQYDVKGNLGSAADVSDMLSRASISLPVGEPKVVADLRKAGVQIGATNSPGRPLELKEWVENSQRFFNNPGAALGGVPDVKDRAVKISSEELNSPSIIESVRQFSAAELAWYWL